MTQQATPTIATNEHRRIPLFEGHEIVCGLPERIEQQLRNTALIDAIILTQGQFSDRATEMPSRTFPALENNIKVIIDGHAEELGEEKVKRITSNLSGIASYLMFTAKAIAKSNQDIVQALPKEIQEELRDVSKNAAIFEHSQPSERVTNISDTALGILKENIRQIAEKHAETLGETSVERITDNLVGIATYLAVTTNANTRINHTNGVATSR